MTSQTSKLVYGVNTGITTIASVVEQARDPTTTDKTYSVGQIWLNSVSRTTWILFGFTSSSGITSAVWQSVGGSSGINTLTGNDSIAVSPTSQNINIVGSGGVSVAGNIGTSTLTISATGLSQFGPVIYRVQNIDLKSTGPTLFFTTPNDGSILMVYQILAYCTAADTITVEASYSVGFNNPTYDNIQSITLISGLTTSGLFYNQFPSTGGSLPSIPANTQVFLDITTAATGNSQTANFYVVGFLV